MNPGDFVDERNISIIPTVLTGGTRDFLIVRPETSETWRLILPVELLALGRVAQMLARLEKTKPALAQNLALTRLLVRNLRFRGTGRHFAAEPWSEDDVRGATLPEDVRTDLAHELSAKQAHEWVKITTGQQPPAGATSELFWRAVVDLPLLPANLDDLELGRFAKALYLHLVPHGDGLVDVNPNEVAAKVNACWKSGFADLGIGAPARELRKVFRRLLALTVKWTGQLAGAAAEEMVLSRGLVGDRPLSAREKRLLELRYGACQALGDVSVGFLIDCGPIMEDLITEYAYVIATGTETEIQNAEENLRKFVYLVAESRTRRKSARAEERRSDRNRHADRMPRGVRHQAEFHADASSPDPIRVALKREELEALQRIVGNLKPRDAQRVQALIDCAGDRRAAAERLGVEPKAFSRQLRQTVRPAIERMLRRREVPETQ